MPPSARLPTVEFRTLLLAPIRVRLQTLHTFTRSLCAAPGLRRAAPTASCLVQRRSLHLYKTAKAKTALGMHKVLDFDRYHVRPLSESPHRVNLVKIKKNSDVVVLEKDLSLQDLYEHVSPGNFIYHADQISKKYDGKFEEIRDGDIAGQNNNYAIGTSGAKKWNTVPVSTKGHQSEGKQLAALKNVILLLTSPVAYVELMLDKAYQFIQLGSPVEFRIRLFASALALKKKGYVPDTEAVPWLLDHFPHLRPDFILKAMPEGTKFLINPVTDGRMLQFVLSKATVQAPTLDLTTRLLRVKAAVEKSLPDNPMAQRYQQNKERRKVVRPLTDEEKAEHRRVIDAAKIRDAGRLSRLSISSTGKGRRRGSSTTGGTAISDALSAETATWNIGSSNAVDSDEDAEKSEPMLTLNKTGGFQKKPGKGGNLPTRHKWLGRGHRS